MTSNRPTTVLGMAAPLVVSFWMRAAITMVDTVYAALLGDDAVAAVGLTVPFEFLMIAVWVGLSTGLTSALSRAMGASRGRRVEQYLRSTWKLVGVVAPAFTLIGAGVWFTAPSLGLEPGVTRAFQVYGTVLLCGSAFTQFWSILPDSLVKAHHDTKSTMWAGIWSNVINVSLNTLFLFVFGWGIFGIALSTVLGRLGGLAYAIARARHHEELRKSSEPPDSLPEDPRPYRTLLGLAVPAAVTFSLMSLETAVVNTLVARMPHATEALAAYSIYYRVVLFALQPMIAISVAMLPFAARRLGEGDGRGVRDGFRQALVASATYCLVFVGPLALVGSEWLANQLSESAVTAEYAEFALYTVPLSCLFGTPFLLCRPVFEAMNRGRPGLVMAVLRYVALTGPLAWAGLRVASALSQPPLYGLIVGLMLAGAIPSLAFWVWLRAELPRELAAEIT